MTAKTERAAPPPEEEAPADAPAGDPQDPEAQDAGRTGGGAGGPGDGREGGADRPEDRPDDRRATDRTDGPKGDARGADGADADDPAGPVAGGAESGADVGPDAVQDDLQTLQDQTAALQEKLLRARADYDNLQKRVAREAALERERVKARFLEDFLRVFEYSHMAVQEAEKQPGALAEGVKMVHREFKRLLEQEGVRMFGAAGDRFDAALHEAVAAERAAGVQAGHVARVVKPGYRLGERVLRFAKVAVVPKEGDAFDADGDASGADGDADPEA